MPSSRSQRQAGWLQDGAFQHHAENTPRGREASEIEQRMEILGPLRRQRDRSQHTHSGRGHLGWRGSSLS